MIKNQSTGKWELSPKYGRDGILGMSISGAGSATAVIFTNPFDVAKCRMQMQNMLLKKSHSSYKVHYKNPVDCIYKTHAANGIAGVQRGLLLSMIRDGSKCFFRLGLYDPLMFRIHVDKDTPAPMYKRITAGSLCGVVASLLCNPLDVLKSRIQAAGGLTTSHHSYDGILHGFRSILKESGVRGLWTGTVVNMVRGASFTAVLMAINSKTKEQLVHIENDAAKNALCAFIASFFGIYLMNPIDVIRTRIYNQSAQGEKLYNGLFHSARLIYKKEGAGAFWKGVTAHYARVGPQTVLAFVFIGEYQKMVRGFKQNEIDELNRGILITHYQP